MIETEDIDETGPVLVITTIKHYVVIEVSSKAIPAHEAHGDIEAGDPEKGDRFTVETVEVVPIGDPG